MPVVDRVSASLFGRIVILNGASSSGKTSLARSLQSRLRPPCQHLQLDAFRAMEPPGYWTNWRDRPAASDRQLAALCRAMNAAVSEYSRHGQAVIFDVALTNPESRAYLLADLAQLPVYLVGVSCSKEVLAQREQARGDREAGLAIRQAEWIHANMQYDLEIDSTTSSPAQCAAAVADWLDGNPAPLAFAAMRARLDAT